jgi:hypothetical protein
MTTPEYDAVVVGQLSTAMAGELDEVRTFAEMPTTAARLAVN